MPNNQAMTKHTLEYICQFYGEVFLQQAYELVLGRPLDEAGKQHYLPLLESGELSKEVIIANIRYSEEGRQQGVCIKGAYKFNQLARVQRWLNNKSYLTGLLPLLLFIETCWRLPRLLKQLQQHENHLQQHSQDSQQLTTVLQALKKKNEQLIDDVKHLAGDTQQLERQFDSNNSYLQGLQNNISNIIEQHRAAPAEATQSQQKAIDALAVEEQGFLDLMYVAFEDNFRGTPQQIKEQVAVYLPLIQASYEQDTPVLDLGCGRGEWLSLLKDNNIAAKGIDLNRVMVAEATRQGLDVATVDAVAYLKEQPANSLSAVTGMHLLEHLPFEVLIRVLQEALRVVKKGGVVIFETPNPENIFVGAQFFYTDPTHKNPLVPDTMKFIFEYIGFKDVEIKRLHSYAEISKAMGKPRNLDDDFKNHHFYNAMDFAIVAKA